MLHVLLVLCMVACAIKAIRTQRLINSAMWLAGVSVLIAITLYVFGATQIAVIELSVGAGLVTVLFVFAINIASDEETKQKSILPGWLTWSLAGLAVLLLGWLALPLDTLGSPVAEKVFGTVLWEQRGLDVLVQIVLIFAAVLGLLSLLGETKAVATAKKAPAAPEIAVIEIPITEQ